MPTATLTWRPFQGLSADAEAAFVSKFCLFSLATMEVGCNLAAKDVGLIEQEHPDAWRWAVVSIDGFVVDAGSEPNRDYAQRAVEQAMRLETISSAALGHS